MTGSVQQGYSCTNLTQVTNMPANTQYIESSDGSELTLDVTALSTALGVTNNASVLVTPSVPFNVSSSVSNVFTVNGPITFTPNTSNAVDGATTYYTLVADGVNAPQFVNFRLSTGTNVYDNRLGIVNVIQFIKLGNAYWYNIFQEVNAQPIDNTAPVISTVRVLTATPSRLDVTFNEALVQNNAVPSNFTVTDRTVTGLNVVGSVVQLLLDSAATAGLNPVVSYTKPPSGLADTALNQVANFTSVPVDVFTTSKPLTLTTRSATVTNVGTSFSSSANSWTSCAVDTTPLIDGASVHLTSVNPGAMIALDNDTTVTGGTVYTQWSYFMWASAGTYYYGTNGSAVTNSTVTALAGDKIRLRRAGASIIGEVQRVSTTAWLSVVTFTTAITSVLYPKFSFDTVGFTNPTYTEVF